MAQREDAMFMPRTVLMTMQSLDDLEDWLLAHNPDGIAENAPHPRGGGTRRGKATLPSS